MKTLVIKDYVGNQPLANYLVTKCICSSKFNEMLPGEVLTFKMTRDNQKFTLNATITSKHVVFEVYRGNSYERLGRE